jgi:hypothetical protein
VLRLTQDDHQHCHCNDEHGNKRKGNLIGERGGGGVKEEK